MYSVSYCATVHGIDSRIVQVEADVSNGLPGFFLVGLLSSEVKEARERVQIAIRNAGYLLPPKKITINLSPANIRKGGTGFDLAIAVSILSAFGYISQNYIKNIMFIGELSFDGKVKEVSGVLPRVFAAQKNGLNCFVVPKNNFLEACLVTGVKIVGVDNLTELVELLSGDIFSTISVNREIDLVENAEVEKKGFAGVSGQTMAKRAASIAVAGMHNFMMIGPPGSGKTMIAKAMADLLPDMTFEERMEISKVYSVAGLLKEDEHCVKKRPFRSPHHTSTRQALIGGGRIPAPGEISLASGGILFLDELAEFSRQSIEALRQPLEDGYIAISRVDGIVRYPAKCQIVAATNPCKCGFYPNREKCNCTRNEVKKYMNRISKPILERIDICVETVPVDINEIRCASSDDTEVYEKVAKAREIQVARYRGEDIFFNSQIPVEKINKYCVFTREAKEYLEQMYQEIGISVRVYHKIIKVARTIADMEECEVIGKHHVAEALCYRLSEKNASGD